MVRDLLEPQRPPQVRQVGQQRGHPAVVGPEELFQGQDGQELVLGEVFLEYLDEYAGMASEATCRAFLANATGERVATRWLVVFIKSSTF